MMKEKLLTFWWFLKRPKMYVQAWQLIIRRLFLRNDRFEDKLALSWCKKNAVSEEEAISMLFPNWSFIRIESKEKETIEKAWQAMNEVPVEMGGAGAIDLIYNITKITNAQTVLETGVAYGWSSLAFLLGMKSQNGKLYSVDMPYPKMENEKFVGIIVPEELKKNWELIPLPDRKGIPKAIKKAKCTFDIIHYDSDKSYSGRNWAYPVLWGVLKKRGVFISDDIQDTISFKIFCEKVGRTPIIIESKKKYVGILIK